MAREGELERFRKTKATALSDEEIDWLRNAGVDLKQLWEAPTTTGRDRKQLLRCLVAEVIVTADRTQGVMEAKVIWVGGKVTALTCKIRQPGVVFPPPAGHRNLRCPPDLQELLVLHRGQVSQGAVKSASIVPVQPLKNKHSSFGNCLEM